jgi:hypothetical protein
VQRANVPTAPGYTQNIAICVKGTTAAGTAGAEECKCYRLRKGTCWGREDPAGLSGLSVAPQKPSQVARRAEARREPWRLYADLYHKLPAPSRRPGRRTACRGHGQVAPGRGSRVRATLCVSSIESRRECTGWWCTDDLTPGGPWLGPRGPPSTSSFPPPPPEPPRRLARQRAGTARRSGCPTAMPRRRPGARPRSAFSARPSGRA